MRVRYHPHPHRAKGSGSYRRPCHDTRMHNPLDGIHLTTRSSALFALSTATAQNRLPPAACGRRRAHRCGTAETVSDFGGLGSSMDCMFGLVKKPADLTHFCVRITKYGEWTTVGRSQFSPQPLCCHNGEYGVGPAVAYCCRKPRERPLAPRRV